MKSNKIFSIALSVFVSFVFVFAVTYAATTISTNINTGGTLTVSDTSTLTGAVTMSSTLGVTGLTTLVNATTTRVSVSNALWVGGNATTTASNGNFETQGGLTVGGGVTTNSITGSVLLAGKTSDPTGVTQGTVYYNSASKVLKLFDGSNWFTVGTTTSGLTLSGQRLQLADLNYYTTFGTTTQSGLSMLTLEATSTAAIPLTLRGFTGQTANLFVVENVGGTDLFTIDASGRLTSNLDVNGYATTTAANGNFATLGTLVGSSTLQVTGAATLYSTLNVSGLTTLANASTSQITTTGSLWVNGFATTTASNGNFATLGSVAIASTSPSFYVALGVTGTTTSSGGITVGTAGSPINAILTGTCTVDPDNGPLAEGAATTTNCTATGVVAGDKVFITPANLLAGLYMVSASSTAGAIQVSIGSVSSTSPTITSYTGWSWMSVR